jgi:hypothetical protein
MKNLISLFVISFLIQACAVTEDVTLKTQLTTAQKDAVEQLRLAVGRTCHKIQYEDAAQTKQRPGQIAIVDSAKVTRLYESTSGWYRGLVNAQGIIDNVYYNSRDKRIVCGQKQWDSFSNSAAIVFSEVGIAVQKTL